jgi:hypothetical protein
MKFQFTSNTLICLRIADRKRACLFLFHQLAKLSGNMARKANLAFLALLFAGSLNAQDSFQVGFLPGINFQGNLKNNMALNLKVESHQQFLSGLYGKTADFHYRYSLTNVSLITYKKVGQKTTLGAGYLVKNTEDIYYHRFMQQYITFKKFRIAQVRQRFMTDQTFSQEEKAEYRVRYRITAEVPFKGPDIDTKELYFKLNNECLNSLQDKHYDLEFRIVPLVGYEFSDASKLEWGLDYRIGHLMSDQSLSSLWLSVNWQVGI